jgi:hypothetical protein
LFFFLIFVLNIFFISNLWLYIPCGLWLLFSRFLIYTRSVGLLGRGISPSQGRYLDTEQTHMDINASNEIRTHDPSARMGEDGSFLIPRVHCDRQRFIDIVRRRRLSVSFSGSRSPCRQMPHSHHKRNSRFQLVLSPLKWQRRIVRNKLNGINRFVTTVHQYKYYVSGH